jgi:DNA-binding LacI/PurR family transcriptional regulator
MKRATIADVAIRAGVSKSTVSHTLSGKRPISEETRRRVFQAIEELGYRPNPVAQRLAGSGHTQTIGFVFPLYAPRIAGLEMEFITGAANVINQANYAFLLLTHPQKDPDHLERFAQSGLVDGFILMQVHLHDPRVEMLKEAKIPFVLVGRCADNTGLPYVDADIEQGLSQCVDHLAELGHRSIAYLHQDDPEFGFTVSALHGFSEACRRHRVSPVTQPCNLTPESGEAAMNALLDQHPDVTAVIVWNDTATLGVIRAAQNRGLHVPDDLSLICSDYSAISNRVSFKPTVIDIHGETIATRAAQMMIDLLENNPLPQSQVLIKPTFIPGDSTTSPRQ